MIFRRVKRDPATLGEVKKIGVYIGVPGLGDLLFIIPLFRALKQRWPSAEVVFIGRLLRGYVKPIFDGCPYIDRLMEYDFYESRALTAHLDFIRRLRLERFDLIVDTQRKFVPSMFLSMGGPRHMVGYSSKGVFSDFEVDGGGRDRRHTGDISLDLARALGIADPAKELEIAIPAEHADYAAWFYRQKGVADTDLVAGIIPSAGHFARNWRAESFARLADRLHDDRGARIIFFGAEPDRAVIESVTGAMAAPAIVEDLSRPSILDSAALMERCNVIVGNDSGPLHIADATGAPCVGIFGPTLPERFGLLGPRTREICLYADCAPCSDPECASRRCLDDITVDTVFDAAVSLID